MNNKKLTTKEFCALADEPLPGFKGTKSEFRKLVKSLLIPPEINKEWKKLADGSWIRE
jgi:hypothetical protein